MPPFYPFGVSSTNDNNTGSIGGQPQRLAQSYPSTQATSSASLLDNKVRRRPLRVDLSDEQKAEIREAFEIFDMDKDGALDFHEFKVTAIILSPWYTV